MLRKKFVRAIVAISSAAIVIGGITPTQAATPSVVKAPSTALYAKAGSKLTATLAKFSSKPTKVSVQWTLNGKSIAKATATSYTIPKSQTTGEVAFTETAMFGKVKKVVKSNTVQIGKLVLVTRPSLAYTDGSNTALAVTTGEVLPAPTQTNIIWQRNGTNLLTDGTSTRTLTLADHGARITASVTYKAPTGFTDLVATTDAQTISTADRIYVQGWSEEFNGANGATADSQWWSGDDGDGVAAGNRGWGNNELQWYRFENATTDGSGHLNILATRTDAASTHCYYGDCQWYSSKIQTKGKIGFTYGRLEARIKGAGGLGTWNAFWTLGANIDTKFWPMCGEIDVTELVGVHPNDVLGYLHGPLSQGWGRGTTLNFSEAWANSYHTYAIDWLPDQVTWYIDGAKYGSVEKSDKDWVFDHEFYVILNLAMGGNLGGTPDAGLNNTTMSVDYVRWSTINGIGTKTEH